MPHTSNEGTGSGVRDDKVTKEIMKTHKELMADEFYIGNASTLDKVCWVHDSHADHLAVKHEGTDAKGDQPSNVDLAPLIGLPKFSSVQFGDHFCRTRTRTYYPRTEPEPEPNLPEPVLLGSVLVQNQFEPEPIMYITCWCKKCIYVLT